MSYTNFFGFRASLWYLTSGKNFMVIRPAVTEIWGCPQMPGSCRADANRQVRAPKELRGDRERKET